MGTSGIIPAIVSGALMLLIPLLLFKWTWLSERFLNNGFVVTIGLVTLCAILPTMYALYNWQTILGTMVVLAVVIKACDWNYDFMDYFCLTLTLSFVGIIIGIIVRLVLLFV